MKRMITISCFIFAAIVMGNAQLVKNVQFEDLQGKKYDLYQLLDEGKYVYFMGGYIG